MWQIYLKRFALAVFLLIVFVGLCFNHLDLTSSYLKIFFSRSSLSIHTTVPSKKFKILFWTKWYSGDPEKSESFNPPECMREFIITSNKSLHSEADVVIFQFVNLKGAALPAKRYPGVPWVLALQESSINTRPLPKSFNGVFNFTWSLRGDSEVHHNFDQMYPRLEKRDEKWIYGSEFSTNFLKNKTKLAAWVVSNCRMEPSKRRRFVQKLETYGIKVDSFGGCSHRSCVRNESCFSNLGKEYKFYMALENSLCVDYITEKPSHGWVHNMVPIIYALGNKTMESPPNSYVDALEFKTMKGLADRIKFLASNPKEYFKYFEWKSVYDLKTPFAYSYHCYAFREIRKVTELIRRKEVDFSNKYRNLEQWRTHYYNKEFNKYCLNCLAPSQISLTNLKRNTLNIFSNPKRCFYSTT